MYKDKVFSVVYLFTQLMQLEIEINVMAILFNIYNVLLWLFLNNCDSG